MSEYLNEVKGEDVQESIDGLVTKDSVTIEMQGESVTKPTTDAEDINMGALSTLHPDIPTFMKQFPDYFDWKLTSAQLNGEDISILSSENQPIALGGDGNKYLSVTYIQYIGRAALAIKATRNSLENNAFVGTIYNTDELGKVMDMIGAHFSIKTDVEQSDEE